MSAHLTDRPAAVAVAATETAVTAIFTAALNATRTHTEAAKVCLAACLAAVALKGTLYIE
jgi:hypothetical protein